MWSWCLIDPKEGLLYCRDYYSLSVVLNSLGNNALISCYNDLLVCLTVIWHSTQIATLKNKVLQILSIVWLTQDQAERRKNRSWFINPFNYCDFIWVGHSLPHRVLCRKQTRCTFQHFLTLATWFAVTHSIQMLPEKAALQETKPYAMEPRHSPRETSALHNMTSENKELFLMCLRLRTTLRQGRKRGLCALLMSRNKTVDYRFV